jgi:hypothetical protein
MALTVQVNNKGLINIVNFICKPINESGCIPFGDFDCGAGNPN